MTMLPQPYPSVDESFDRLHRAGWSIGEIAGVSCWVVSGQNGENVIVAEGQSQAEAWYRATLQAEAGACWPSRERKLIDTDSEVQGK
jgi:hypothetical protein